MKINREDVVQAALVIERWCKSHCTDSTDECDCPLASMALCWLEDCSYPKYWGLEEFLRTRGAKHD